MYFIELCSINGKYSFVLQIQLKMDACYASVANEVLSFVSVFGLKFKFGCLIDFVE